MTNSDDAPFHIPSEIYSLRIDTAYRHLDRLEEALESYGDSTARMELDGSHTIDPLPDDPWAYYLYIHKKPDMRILDPILTLLQNDIPSLIWRLEEVEKKDWVSEQQHVEPIDVAPFFLYHPNYEGDVPSGRIPIQLRAGQAFGTGEHETTQGCLEALGKIPSCDRTAHILDLGSGTGVLAMAAYKRFHCDVLGTDIEEEAVISAKEHARANAAESITFIHANGLDHPDIHAITWDVIMANVLAQPLIDWAPSIAAHLKPSGYVILSGFLDYQEAEIAKAYATQGLVVVNRICHHGWVTLTYHS